MFVAFLAALLVQTETPPPAAPSPPPLLPEKDPYAECRCPASAEEAATSFVGVAKDARLRLGPDGRSVLPRQATVFSVISADDSSIRVGADVSVWHVTAPADCGVTFDYGRRYEIRARKADDGLETDWCLDPRRARR